MRKQILTDNETKTFLMKTFKCSRQAVWQALNFVRDSDQARRIRILALKRGGKLTDGGFIPNCETTFEECEHTINCTFGSRVKIVVDRKSNDVDLYVDGKRTETYQCEFISDLMQLQHETQQLAAAL